MVTTQYNARTRKISITADFAVTPRRRRACSCSAAARAAGDRRNAVVGWLFQSATGSAPVDSGEAEELGSAVMGHLGMDGSVAAVGPAARDAGVWVWARSA